MTNFFPLQSMTSSDALQAAQNDIQAAVGQSMYNKVNSCSVTTSELQYLEALSQQPLTTVGATTTTTYSPDAISNCYTGQPIPGCTLSLTNRFLALTKVGTVGRHCEDAEMKSQVVRGSATSPVEQSRR